MTWLSVTVHDRDIAGKIATSEEYASAQSALDDSLAEFVQAVKLLGPAPDPATAERFSSAFDRYANDLKDVVLAVGNVLTQAEAERAYASGWNAGFTAKGDAPQPVVNVSFDPGAIAVALPDAVRVQLEPSRSEAVVQRGADGKLTGIRTVSQ
jgi:hypothetical protein